MSIFTTEGTEDTEESKENRTIGLSGHPVIGVLAASGCGFCAIGFMSIFNAEDTEGRRGNTGSRNSAIS
jgi:hypothetical protein